MNVPLWAWIALVAGTVIVIAVDLLFISKANREMGLRTALIWTGIWISLGLVFAVVVGVAFDSRYATEYLSGFLLEYSLSMDNVFVFIVLFAFFAVPPAAKLRVLTIGILIALGLRLIAILVGGVVIAKAEWVLYLFGAFLLYTAWKLIRHVDEPADPEKSAILKLIKRRLPMTGTYDGQKFRVKVDGKWMYTTLTVVLVMLAGTDIVFALDSIPAAFGVTREPFLVFAVNAFALMGLRSLFFVLEGLVDRFPYLSYGLAIVLAFVGAKMLVKDFWHSPIWLSLTVIVVVLGTSIIYSWIKTKPPRMA
ncbi:MAG: TerC/Alx family metal homeostasis membrane protein [Thermoleophilia bacterium]|nr:TerC/Alx family metal homeostasis membrane protein [Thermoleophilia bacterium]